MVGGDLKTSHAKKKLRPPLRKLGGGQSPKKGQKWPFSPTFHERLARAILMPLGGSKENIFILNLNGWSLPENIRSSVINVFPSYTTQKPQKLPKNSVLGTFGPLLIEVSISDSMFVGKKTMQMATFGAKKKKFFAKKIWKKMWNFFLRQKFTFA